MGEISWNEHFFSLLVFDIIWKYMIWLDTKKNIDYFEIRSGHWQMSVFFSPSIQCSLFYFTTSQYSLYVFVLTLQKCHISFMKQHYTSNQNTFIFGLKGILFIHLVYTIESSPFTLMESSCQGNWISLTTKKKLFFK